MKAERKFYKCPLCGNIVGVIENGGGQLVCCGREMIQLIPNTEEAATEKHIPVAKREDGILYVKVGSVEHPMSEEHHISWIAVAQGAKTHRVSLDITGAPAAQFCIEDGPLTVYAYCNLHGLWAAEL